MIVNQETYIKKTFKRSSFENKFSKNTLMTTRQVANRERRQREEDDSYKKYEKSFDISYQESIGSLLKFVSLRGRKFCRL